jgi:hypothetical protein
VERQHGDPANQRNQHIAAINADGRIKWQVATAYGKR